MPAAEWIDQTAGQDCHWGRGNGWVVAALVRVPDIMPEDAPHCAGYEQTYLQMMRALPRLQRPSGYWNVSLHDPTHFGGKRLTGTALFTYGRAWGVRQGLLDKAQYQPLILLRKPGTRWPSNACTPMAP